MLAHSLQPLFTVFCFDHFETSRELKARAKEHGVVAWIVKPHKDEILLGGIRKVLKLS